MSLNPQHQHLIVTIDEKTNTVLANGGNEALLFAETRDLIPDIQSMLNSAPKKAMEMYLYGYKGFYHYMKKVGQQATVD